MAAIALGIALAACGAARLPRPPLAPHPTSALVEVPYPPPPARVEFMPDSPQKGAVWVDGEWSFRGRLWWWKPGAWVLVPAGATYSPWISVRSADGTLYFARGRWRNPHGEDLPSPKPLARAKPNLGAIVDPVGETEETGLGLDALEQRGSDGGT